MLKKILFSFMLIAIATAFASCECHDNEDELNESVNPRMYKTYLEGSWVLTNEDGYADFDCNGIKELFNSDINNSETYSTLLTFDSNDNCTITPYCHGKYQFCMQKHYKYIVSIEGVLTIYDKKYDTYDKTFKIEEFKEKKLRLTYYSHASYVTFTFDYCETNYGIY